MAQGAGVNQYKRLDGEAPRRSGGELLRHVSDPRKWLVRVFIGKQAGRKQRIAKVVNGGRREAERELTALLKAKHDGTLRPRSALTIAELASEWLEIKRGEIAARTLDGYEHLLELYALPILGALKVGELTPRDLDTFYSRLLRGDWRRPDGTKGRELSGRTVQMVAVALRQALALAQRWEIIASNPAERAKPPSGKTSREKDVLSISERAAFLNACEGSVYAAFYRVMLDAGLRPGETCALTWDHVDLRAGLLRIEAAMTRGPGGAPTIAPPKTTKSRRTVHLLEGLRVELERHRIWQRRHGLDQSGHVFTSPTGQPLTPWSFNKRDLRRVLAQARIKKSISLYSLRHSFATAHVAAGTPVKAVSSMLGHASAAMTLDVYQHADPEVSRDWMERFEQALAPAPRAREEAVN